MAEWWHAFFVTDNPFVVGSLAGGLAVLLAFVVAICGLLRFTAKPPQMDEAARDEVLRRIMTAHHPTVTLTGPATKGFKAGFTKDDAVVYTRERRPR